MKLTVRNSLAAFFRTLPYFPGKYRLGPKLIPLLTNYEIEKDCMVTCKMHDGSIMHLDIRSFTEQKAFFAGEYDGGIIQRISSILKPGSTVFDIGANIGFYSIALGRNLKKLAGGSKLWAFEPVAPNFSRLSKLVEINDLENTVYPVNIALGNQEGEIPLCMVDESNHANTGNAFWVKEGMTFTTEVTCSSKITQLDKFVRENNLQKCDFIKVDIEGAELDFLLGGKNFINKTRPIIYAECNSYWTKEFGYSFLDVADLVGSWKYNLYRQIGRKNFVKIKKNHGSSTDVLMVPQEQTPDILNSLGVIN
ncbi:MAG: FkbM family methyltransferase [Nostocaceae cyanobacterium]|nr:FkbM family methyltransferase [Nostocaceae cyanobacterium]